MSEATQDSKAIQAAELATLAAQLVSAADHSAREAVAARILAQLQAAAASTTAPTEPKPQPLRFTSTTGIYGVMPECSAFDLRDQLDARLSQLSAMLTMLCGAGFEGFAQHNQTVQSNILWCCSSLADEAQELTHHMTRKEADEMERAEAPEAG